MKIYINGRFMSQKVTGVQRVAYEYIKKLDELMSKTSNDFEFILLIPRDQLISDITFKNIKIKKIGLFKGNLWEQLSLPFLTFNNLLINFCNTAPILKKRKLVYIHDTAVFDIPIGFSTTFVWWYKLMLKLVGMFSLKILTVSNFSKSRLVSNLNIKSKSVSVIYPGSDHIQFIEEGESVLSKFNLYQGEYILAVGSLHPNKNFKVFSKVLEKGLINNKEIVIVGSYNKNTTSSKKNYQGNKNVKHLGYVSDQELKSLYKNAKLFIFPSLYEGFGLPPIEAMSMGCPVIASNAASIPEVCKNAAFYFNPKSENELVNGINKLFNDEILRSTLISNGFKVSKQYTWETSVNSLIKELEELEKL